MPLPVDIQTIDRRQTTFEVASEAVRTGGRAMPLAGVRSRPRHKERFRMSAPNMDD